MNLTEETWEAVEQAFLEMRNKETPVLAIDVGSDGQERYQCPCCGDWWYDQLKYCHNCGHRISYR